MPIAVITGATSGIGAAFARRLAAEGYSLVLVARSAGRLATCATELHQQFGVPATPLVADLATPEGCGAVEKLLADPGDPVDMLVNSAGFGLAGTFWDSPLADADRQLQLNVRAVLRLSHAALGGMVRRGSGDVINVSSVAGFTSGARGATYVASKSWVTAFSESLGLQLAGSGVHVSALCPGFTRTEFHVRAGLDPSKVPDGLWLDADHVVATGLRDHRRGRPVSIPGMPYKVVVVASRLVPRRLIYKISAMARKRLP
jgi:short-subunit dehydrogenase